MEPIEDDELRNLIDKRQDSANTGKGRSSLNRTVSSTLLSKIREASAKGGRVEIAKLLKEAEREQLDAILNMREGDRITAEFENPDNINDYERDVVLLKRNGVVIGQLDTVDDINESTAVTIAIRNSLKSRKSINLRIREIKNTGDNIWATRQHTGDLVGSNNSIISKIVAKVENITGKSFGGYNIARVPRDSNRQQLINVITGDTVDLRSKPRLNKFYIEVPTVGNKTIWFPLNNSTISEAEGIDKEFGKRLLSETTHRIIEYVKAVKNYQTAYRNYNTEVTDESKIALDNADSELKLALKNLNELIATGKYKTENKGDKSYFNYEKNIYKNDISRLSKGFISSDSVIMSNGQQGALNIITGFNEDSTVVFLNGVKYVLDNLTDAKSYELFENIASAMTRQIEINANGTLVNKGKFELKLRNKKGNNVKTYTYNSYAEYVDTTGALLTDLGALTNNGNPVTNLNLTASDIFTLDLELDAKGETSVNSKIEIAEQQAMTAEEFISKYIPDDETYNKLKTLIRALSATGVKILDVGFTAKDLVDFKVLNGYNDVRYLKSLIDEYNELGKLNTDELTDTQLKRLNTLDTLIEDEQGKQLEIAKDTMMMVDPATNTMYITSIMQTMLNDAHFQYENGNESKAEYLYEAVRTNILHETLHPILSASLSPYWGSSNNTELKSKLEEYNSEVIRVIDQIIEKSESVIGSKHLKLSNSERAAFRAYVDIIKNARDITLDSNRLDDVVPMLEELFTYAFTHKTVAKVLNEMYYDPREGEDISGESKTLFQKLIDMLLKLIGISSVNENTQLSKLKKKVGE